LVSDLLTLYHIASYQFGFEAADLLFKNISGDIKIKKSRKTKKIRYIYINNELFLVLRARDGLFSLTHLSATKLLGLKPPSLRVIVSNEAVPFVKEGKSVFARFVIDVDKSLRRGDEVIVVSSRDELIAIGKMMVSGEEAMELETGEIVKIKKSIRGVY